MLVITVIEPGFLIGGLASLATNRAGCWLLQVGPAVKWKAPRRKRPREADFIGGDRGGSRGRGAGPARRRRLGRRPVGTGSLYGGGTPKACRASQSHEKYLCPIRLPRVRLAR